MRMNRSTPSLQQINAYSHCGSKAHSKGDV
jgi:hypothetical protein